MNREEFVLESARLLMNNFELHIKDIYWIRYSPCIMKPSTTYKEILYNSRIVGCVPFNSKNGKPLFPFKYSDPDNPEISFELSEPYTGINDKAREHFICKDNSTFTLKNCYYPQDIECFKKMIEKSFLSKDSRWLKDGAIEKYYSDEVYMILSGVDPSEKLEYNSSSKETPITNMLDDFLPYDRRTKVLRINAQINNIFKQYLDDSVKKEAADQAYSEMRDKGKSSMSREELFQFTNQFKKKYPGSLEHISYDKEIESKSKDKKKQFCLDFKKIFYYEFIKQLVRGVISVIKWLILIYIGIILGIANLQDKNTYEFIDSNDYGYAKKGNLKE